MTAPDFHDELRTRPIRIQETGEVIEAHDVPIMITCPTVLLNGKAVHVHAALGILGAQVNYWRERAVRFETELADLRAGVPGGA